MPDHVPNHHSDRAPQEVRDKDTPLQRDALTKAERHATLLFSITQSWANRDIGAIERWDEDNWHGWLMWPYKPTSP